MADRTLGWIQNPSDTLMLHRVVSLFDPHSDFTQIYLTQRIPLIAALGKLHDRGVWETYISAVRSGGPMPYASLKGKGCGSGSRANALCSGILQAAIDAQKKITFVADGAETTIKKPYTDDWTADGFLRWAISIGFVAYDSTSDECSITELGRRFVATVPGSDDFKAVLGEAYLMYPPACCIMSLLSRGEHLTKFEIGKRLGFTTEAGFTSYPQNIFVQSLIDNPENRSDIMSNYEGSSDKYARMICSWLAEIGWVQSAPKEVVDHIGRNEYTCTLTGYSLTAEGIKNLKRATGKSRVRKLPKIVYFEMLSTKASDRSYLRMRRALILDYLHGHTRSYDAILHHLSEHGFTDEIGVVKDDIAGFVNIGLNVTENAGNVTLADKLICLEIPSRKKPDEKSEVLLVKERVRSKLRALDPTYLRLVDLAYDGTADREFEISTIDLFTNELDFEGKHLGGSRKPDGIIYRDCNGLLIDNKAYSKGYSLPRAQVDEMGRYVRENKNRNAAINPLKWWENFPNSVTEFNFAFISSFFTGQYAERLSEIYHEYGVKGGVIDVENLLYIAEGLKSGELSYSEFFGLFDNSQILF